MITPTAASRIWLHGALLGSLALALTLGAGCGGRRLAGAPPQDGSPPADRGRPRPDARDPCQDPAGDEDHDGLPNGMEDCAGKRDTDGDKLPDYLDMDSDGDGMLDGTEDPNADGQVGCCIIRCNQPGSAWQKANCKLNADGCGEGQRCKNGVCTPAASCGCWAKETSPYKKDTFGGGKLDSEYPCSGLCANPWYSRPVQTRTSAATRGDWQVVLEKSARYVELGIKDPGQKMHAAAIDHDRSGEQVAGFVLSRAPARKSVHDELAALIGAVQSDPPGGSKTRVTQRASGIAGLSHDRFQIVRGTTLDLYLDSPAMITSARDQVLAALLGKPRTALSNLPQPRVPASTDLVLRFSTIKRGEQRLLVIGALATNNDHQNPKHRAGMIVDDLAGGTALARAAASQDFKCDVHTIQTLPTADIIWVVGEQTSMSDSRNDLINNANNFFSRALSTGLDFRMGVTNVCSPGGPYKATVGKLCSKISSDIKDPGGADRFLLPSEQTTFSSCIKNPPGYRDGSSHGLVNAREAVKNHLPRAANDPTRIRSNATLVIILVTDQVPQSLASIIGSVNTRSCTLPAANQAALSSALSPHLNLLSGVTDPEAAAMFHLIGGVCGNTCMAQVAHGYSQIAQNLNGHIIDVCQKNLGQSLQAVVDSITARASPIKLDTEPVSATLAVALDAIALQRSRTNGFYYHPEGDSVVFTNVKYRKGSEFIAAYGHWR